MKFAAFLTALCLISTPSAGCAKAAPELIPAAEQINNPQDLNCTGPQALAGFQLVGSVILDEVFGFLAFCEENDLISEKDRLIIVQDPIGVTCDGLTEEQILASFKLVNDDGIAIMGEDLLECQANLEELERQQRAREEKARAGQKLGPV